MTSSFFHRPKNLLTAEGAEVAEKNLENETRGRSEPGTLMNSRLFILSTFNLL
jgi:hypothetical protein